MYELFSGNIYLGDSSSKISFISTDKTDAVKIFDTMDVDGGVYKDNKEFYNGKNICPIKEVEVTNDYQEANGNNFKKKFRLWRTQLPRDGRKRIRNPWA
nr:MAG TPA: stabilization protein [Crassvirales sp.]